MDGKLMNVRIVVLHDGEVIRSKEIAKSITLEELLELCDAGLEDISNGKSGEECLLSLSPEGKEMIQKYVSLSNRTSDVVDEWFQCRSSAYIFKESVRDMTDYVFDYFEHKLRYEQDITQEAYIAMRRTK